MTHRIDARFTLKAACVAVLAALVATICLVPRVYSAGPQRSNDDGNGIRRVLLISIDGMHALDYENCVNSGTCPNLAALGKNGLNYTRTSTSKPSVCSSSHFCQGPRDLGMCTRGQPNGTTTEYE